MCFYLTSGTCCVTNDTKLVKICSTSSGNMTEFEKTILLQHRTTKTSFQLLHVTATTTLTFSAQHFFFFFFEFVFFILIIFIWFIQIFSKDLFFTITSIFSIRSMFQYVSSCISYLFFSVVLWKTVWTKEYEECYKQGL